MFILCFILFRVCSFWWWLLNHYDIVLKNGLWILKPSLLLLCSTIDFFHYTPSDEKAVSANSRSDKSEQSSNEPQVKQKTSPSPAMGIPGSPFDFSALSGVLNVFYSLSSINFITQNVLTFLIWSYRFHVICGTYSLKNHIFFNILRELKLAVLIYTVLYF